MTNAQRTPLLVAGIALVAGATGWAWGAASGSVLEGVVVGTLDAAVLWLCINIIDAARLMRRVTHDIGVLTLDAREHHKQLVKNIEDTARLARHVSDMQRSSLSPGRRLS